MSNGITKPADSEAEQALRVLIIEDEDIDYCLLREQIRTSQEMNTELTRASSLSEALDILDTAEFDLIATDLGLPDSAGVEVIQNLKAKVPDVPLVAITGTGDEQVALEATKVGAQDYLVKGRFSKHQMMLQMQMAVQRQSLLRLAHEREVYERHVRDSLVSHVSHELRTPLAAILQYANILNEELVGPVSSEQRDCLEVIERNVSSLESMVSEMVDASRTMLGKLSLRLSAARIEDLVDQVIKNCGSQADRKSIRLSSRGDGKAIKGLVDHDRLAQAVTNLVVNAIKFTPDKGHVGVRFRADDKRLHIRVVDTGHGIAPVDQERIFGRLCQVGTDEEASRVGLGLGLHITKSIVEAHQGSISLRSKPGLGSTFTISLPLDPIDAAIDEHRKRLPEQAEQHCAELVIEGDTEAARARGVRPVLMDFHAAVSRVVRGSSDAVIGPRIVSANQAVLTLSLGCGRDMRNSIVKRVIGEVANQCDIIKLGYRVFWDESEAESLDE